MAQRKQRFSNALVILALALVVLIAVQSGRQIVPPTGLPTGPTCTDTEVQYVLPARIAYNVRGTITLGGASLTDTCVSGTKLREYYCARSGSSYQSSYREVTCTCVNGACRNPVSECNDGLDNDGDGVKDYGTSSSYPSPYDPQCSSTQDPQEESDAYVPECRNYRDDDADALIDHFDDAGCKNGWDWSEKPECADINDNDGDGRRDFAAPLGYSPTLGWGDTKCSSAQDDDENPKDSCGTYVDPRVPQQRPNAVYGDNEGVPFRIEDACVTPQSIQKNYCGTRSQDYAPQSTMLSCSSGCINGLCPPLGQCRDGIDNDGDRKVDMADTGCTSPAALYERPLNGCTDSDGQNYYTRGVLTHLEPLPPDPHGQSWRDHCISSGLLREYSCGSQALNYIPQWQDVSCGIIIGPGSFCANGVCTPRPTSPAPVGGDRLESPQPTGFGLR